MRTILRVSGIGIVGLLFHLFQISAQTPLITLKPADASLFHEFTAVGSIRELADGRILVSDPLDHVIVVADFRTGKVANVGRIGAGPGEYPGAWTLWPMSADSTIMMDPLRRRWTFFRGASVVGQLPPDNPMPRESDLEYGADTMGHVLGRRGITPIRSTSDSSYLLFFTLATARVDTVARLFPFGPEPKPYVIAAYFRWDRAAIAPDGWIAVVRVNEYRVDWRTPTGRWLVGKSIPHESPAFNDREQKAWVREHGWHDLAAARPSLATAAIVPPYSNGQLLPSPDRTLLIERTRTADHPNTRYDIVNRSGQLDGQIEMPPRANIEAFGRHSVYVVIRNFDDDTEHIERHPWP